MKTFKPDGFATISPHIVCRDSAKAIEFYKNVFGAKEANRFLHPQTGIIMHAELKIGDSTLMLTNEAPDWGCFAPNYEKGAPITLHLYVEDTDTLMKRAEQEGAEVLMPAEDSFWGDRYGQIKDPFGHIWAIASHLKDMTKEEVEEAAKKAFAIG